ncbi:hypothetical protein GCM10027048_05700 [Hymenobacter coalescens]
MRPELTRLQRIEAHLLAPAAPAAAAAWQLELLLDPALAHDAATQQQLYEGLQLAGRQQLRRELRQIHRELYGPASGGWLRGAAAGLRALLRRRFRPRG